MRKAVCLGPAQIQANMKGSEIRGRWQRDKKGRGKGEGVLVWWIFMSLCNLNVHQILRLCVFKHKKKQRGWCFKSILWIHQFSGSAMEPFLYEWVSGVLHAMCGPVYTGDVICILANGFTLFEWSTRARMCQETQQCASKDIEEEDCKLDADVNKAESEMFEMANV